MTEKRIKLLREGRDALHYAGFLFLYTRDCNNCHSQIEVWQNPPGTENRISWWKLYGTLLVLHNSKECAKG